MRTDYLRATGSLMSKNFVFSLLLLFLSVGVWGQGTEDFSNIPANNGTYATRNWVGTNGVYWNATNARTDQTLSGRAICTDGTGTITSPSYTGGMGILSFNYVRGFTGTNARSIEVYVNGSKIGATISVSSTSDVVVNYSEVINISGNVQLEIRTSGKQIKIDDISWTSFAAIPCSGTPSGGTTSLTANSGTAGTNYTVSAASYTTGFSGLSYQWQSSVNGATWTNVGGSTSSYGNYNATASAAGDVVQWRLQISCGVNVAHSSISTFNVTHPSPNNALSLTSCIANNQITLKWNAATGSPTGYMVFAQPNATIPTMASASAGNASSYTANLNYTLASTYGTLGKLLYKGTATTATITNLTNASQYTFKVVAYRGETNTGWAPGIATSTGSWILTSTIDVPEVSNLAASVNPNSSTVTWLVVPDSAGCYEYMVVANQGAVSFTPSGNGSAYSAVAAYAGSNQVVYKGTGNSVVVSGLAFGTNYCYRVYVRELNSGNQWSDGISVCQTTGLNYCASQGTSGEVTGISGVVFNTINNISSSNPAYFDHTSISTTVLLGENYDLTVNVNTDGFQNYTKAWIDWNRDGDFNDSGEEYDLGDAFSGNNEPTSNSPLTISVPPNASLGTARMRIATQYFFEEEEIELTPCGTYDYGEVEDYTLNVVRPSTAEINVRGNAISIPNGFDSPYGLNNTQFSGTPLNTDSAEKEFTIENLGLTNLILSGTPTTIQLAGDNPLDFVVAQHATSPITTGASTTFKIKFRPTAAGLRTAIVTIGNNDTTGGENPYTFMIEGNGTCATPIIAASPTTGPANTLVTFTSSTSNLTGATVEYNGEIVPLVSEASGKLEVLVPIDAADGYFSVQLATGCEFTQPFNVIDEDITNCQPTTGTTASGLIIYEVFDVNGGSSGYISIYNGTSAAINLSGYKIERAGDYGGSYSTYATLTGTLASGALAVVAVSGSTCGYTVTGNGSIGSGGFNANDGLRLVQGTTVIDDVRAPNYVGFYLKRKIAFLTPSATYNPAHWERQATGSYECVSNFGVAPIFTYPPTINVHPTFTAVCNGNPTTLSVTATEGVAGGNTLQYQWYILGTSGWNALSNGSVYSGVNSQNLVISSVSVLNNAQFYVQVRENGATCYTASNAVQIKFEVTEWTGSWSNGLPDITKNIVFSSSYNSASDGGSVSACQCEVKNGVALDFSPTHHLEIETSLHNNGTIRLENAASLVQNLDGITNTGTGTIEMKRITTPMYRYDFTYWSSPLEESPSFTLNTLSPGTLPDKYFKWNTLTQNWQTLMNGASPMDEGIGYIVRAPQSYAIEGQTGATPQPYMATFTGKPNNGMITVPVVGGTDQWNLIGNPYPSAIDARDFILHSGNENLDGTLYFWTHNSPPSASNPGTATYNYSSDDYASYNLTGSVATAVAAETGDDDPINNNDNAPDGTIPAGQSFFVLGDVAGDAVFSNTMRTTGPNSNFYRQQNNTTEGRVWLNLVNDTRFHQMLIGYVDQATNGKDRGFDGILMGGSSANLSSLIGTEKFTIQGRSLPFEITDEVPLSVSFVTAGNYKILIDHLDGFFNTQDIFLKDNNLNVIHNLKTAPYEFTTTTGNFNNRFVLVYRNSSLDKPEFDLAQNQVYVLNQSEKLLVKSIEENLKTVVVYDLLGREIHRATDIQTKEYPITGLLATEQTLLIQIELENGMKTTKKAMIVK